MDNCDVSGHYLWRSLYYKHNELQEKGKESLLLLAAQGTTKRFNIDRIAQASSDKVDKDLDAIVMAVDRQGEMSIEKDSVLLLA